MSDRDVTEPYQAELPRHKPPIRSRGRASAKNAGTERVSVDDPKGAPKGRAKAVPKSTAKQIEALTVTGFDVAQWFVRPNTIQSADGSQSPIWPIDKSDPMEAENLRVFCDNAAKLINRLPDRVRRYLVVTMTGGELGAEITGALRAMLAIIGSRKFLMMMATQQEAPTQAGSYRANDQTGEALVTMAAD